MSKIGTIIGFEYISRVRRRSFILATIFTPFLILLPIGLSAALTFFGLSKIQIVVLDQSGVPGLFESVKEKNRGAAKYDFSYVPVPPDQDLDQFRLRFNSEISNGSGKSYLVFREGILDGVPPEFYTGGGSDFGMENLVRSIDWAVIDHRLANAGLNSERYLRPVGMKRIRISPTGEARESVANLGAAFVIFIFTFFRIFGYGSRVMSGIISEKYTRITEILVSSAKPFELMMGKLVGIGLVGLTQYLIWVAFAIPIKLIGQSVLAAYNMALNPIPIISVLWFVIYFVLGYFLFASLYVIGGALVTDNESGNAMTRFVPILSMVPLFAAPVVMQNPNGAPALALSVIPLFSAGTMVLRIAISSPPLWQILLSISLMILTIVAAIWIAAKIYRLGILIYGKKPRWREIVRWIRYA